MALSETQAVPETMALSETQAVSKTLASPETLALSETMALPETQAVSATQPPPFECWWAGTGPFPSSKSKVVGFMFVAFFIRPLYTATN
jgi:hypothetical protein